MKFKRACAAFLSAVTVLLLAVPGALSARAIDSPPDVVANAAMMVNIETGQLMYEKNTAVLVAPASTVKIMTGLLALENIPDLTVQITAQADAVNQTYGNNMALSVGEVLTAKDLIYALLIDGDNDAANVLAQYLSPSGSIGDFVAMMNKKAQDLGMGDTHYTNPTGMDDPSMVTTAADMMKLAQYAFKNNTFMDITSAVSYTIPPTSVSPERPLYNRNYMVSTALVNAYYYVNTRGMNAGSTAEGGYCVIGTTAKSGLTYLYVIMGSTAVQSPTTGLYSFNSYVDAGKLLDWAFASYALRTVISTEDVIDEAPVSLSMNTDHVTLVPQTDIIAMLAVDVDLQNDITRDIQLSSEKLVAPIKKGDVLGVLNVSYQGQPLGSTPLVAQSDVESSSMLVLLNNISNITHTEWFIASIIAFVVISICYLLARRIRSKGATERRRLKF